MRELRTLKRTRLGSRVRSVQGRLSIEFGDEDEVGGDQLKVEPPVRSSGFRRPSKSSALNQERSPGVRTTAPVFHPLAYRSVVAGWPLEWRELWGQRANELEETGLSWRDAETQSFVEVWHKYRSSTETSSTETPPSSTPPADE